MNKMSMLTKLRICYSPAGKDMEEFEFSYTSLRGQEFNLNVQITLEMPIGIFSKLDVLNVS